MSVVNYHAGGAPTTGLMGRLNGWIGRNTWPPNERVAALWEELDILAGLLAQDDWIVRSTAQSFGMGAERLNYVPLPVPRLITKVKTNLLFGRPPQIRPEKPADTGVLDDMVEANALSSELRRGQAICSAEGEVWWKVRVDPEVLGWPILEFCSRRHVLPKWAGRFLVGATFVSEYVEGSGGTVWRVLETHERGLITTELYRGTTSILGERRALDSFEPTRGMEPEMATYGELLCGWVPNVLERDPTRGMSDYVGVVLAFFALNEAATIGQGNVRLTGKKRLFVDGRYLNERGSLPGGDDVFRSDRTELIPGDNGGIKAAEYTFESEHLTNWLEHVMDLALTFAGVSPASVGRTANDSVRTGTAMKLKMSHTLMEAAGTGENWDRAMRVALRAMAILDSKEFRHGWSEPDALPSFIRSDGLPRDTVEEAQELQMLDAAGAVSTETKVRRIHPDWSDEQVDEEVQRIADDATAQSASAFGGQPTGTADRGPKAIAADTPQVVLGGSTANQGVQKP